MSAGIADVTGCAHDRLVCASCGRVVATPSKERARPSDKSTEPVDPLVGKFFHTWKDGKISMQGVIESVVPVEPRRYVTTTFSWLDGSDHQSHVVGLDDMREWTFYASSKEMNHFYEHRYPGKWAR